MTSSGDVLFSASGQLRRGTHRIHLGFFEFDDPGVAEMFGLEVARQVVDTSSPELVARQRVIEWQTAKSPYRR